MKGASPAMDAAARPPGWLTAAPRFDPKLLAGLQGLEFKARYVMEGFLSGLHESPFHGFSVEFSDYRDYQPGDDLRHVDWRLYARSDKLHIKRYLEETNARFYLLCDSSASMAYQGAAAWASKWDCARILAGALAWLLLRQNDAVGLVSLAGDADTPRYVRPSQKSTQLGLLLRELERCSPAGGGCLPRLLEQAARLAHRRSVLVLFSDLLEPAEALESGLRRLRFLGHECIVLQCLDRDETDFPFTEARVFEDLETGLRRAVHPDAARESYLARFDQFMAAHRRLLQSLEVPHGLVRTDQDPSRALACFLQERKRMQ